LASILAIFSSSDRASSFTSAAAARTCSLEGRCVRGSRLLPKTRGVALRCAPVQAIVALHGAAVAMVLQTLQHFNSHCLGQPTAAALNGGCRHPLEENLTNG
jgi:hypothetical protein